MWFYSNIGIGGGWRSVSVVGYPETDARANQRENELLRTGNLRLRFYL